MQPSLNKVKQRWSGAVFTVLMLTLSLAGRGADGFDAETTALEEAKRQLMELAP